MGKCVGNWGSVGGGEERCGDLWREVWKSVLMCKGR